MVILESDQQRRSQPTVDDVVGRFRSLFLLEMLDNTMCLQGVGDSTAKFELDASTVTVGSHQRGVLSRALVS